MSRFFHSILFFILFLSLTSCFGKVDKAGSVYDYNEGRVMTKGGEFQIGKLGKEWERQKFSYRAILFQHKKTLSTISINSFCGNAFDDGPLELLSRQLFYGVTDQKVKLKKKINIDGREALRQSIKGEMDGAAVVLDTVVLKMNECVFDFVSVSHPKSYKKIVSDFESLFEGFRYIRGPKLD